MKKIIYISICLVITVLFCASCDDFLDKNPDNRATPDTKEKIGFLLVSAYPYANYSVLSELSSDNFIDNNSPGEGGVSYNLASLEKMHEEIFAWQAVKSSDQQDSPGWLWGSCYNAIATANQVLQAIEDMESKGTTEDLSGLRGEALLCRAYSHFILVNIFCQAYKDDAASSSDVGIPYVTKLETTVDVDYPRESVAAVYGKIEQDLENGIKLLTDEYEVPAYHFTKNAANAFAARFYLYKRNYQKVISSVNAIFGNDAASVMRSWSSFSTRSEFSYDYIDQNKVNNIMMLATTSWFGRIYGTRYGHNRSAMNGCLYGTGPTWGNFLPVFQGNIWYSNSSDYGYFTPKATAMFEYSDKVAQIGFDHIVRAEFTTNEALLCRAEAYVMTGDFEKALNDLQTWNASYKAQAILTDVRIKNFYTNASNKALFAPTLNNKKMSEYFEISDAQRPYIHCVLHFRRIETLFDGLRWFDLKRFGIEITHAIGKSTVDKLTYDDPRRAIQIPQSVIGAGMVPNPTTTQGPSTEQNVRAGFTVVPPVEKIVEKVK